MAKLDVQYRMHPAISKFPNEHFYARGVSDYLDKAAYESKFPAVWNEDFPNCFGPLRFYNVHAREEKDGYSFTNPQEADFVLILFRALYELYPGKNWTKMVGVISPYEKQVNLIRKRFKELFGKAANEPSPVEVKTVDGFQGSEKEVIILSTVRCSNDGGIGFVKDANRTNVCTSV